MTTARDVLAGMIAGRRRVRVADVVEEAARYGISERTVRRAARASGLVSRRAGFGPGSVMWWETPQEPPRRVNGATGHDRAATSGDGESGANPATSAAPVGP